MTQKFVVRLLTEEGGLLGWCEHHLKPVPSQAEACSRFGPPGTVSDVLLTAAGFAVYISVEWCDVDVARKFKMMEPMDIPESAIGTVAAYHWMGSMWGVQGTPNCPLPPVTVGRPVVLNPPPAAIGARP